MINYFQLFNVLTMNIFIMGVAVVAIIILVFILFKLVAFAFDREKTISISILVPVVDYDVKYEILYIRDGMDENGELINKVIPMYGIGTHRMIATFQTKSRSGIQFKCYAITPKKNTEKLINELSKIGYLEVDILSYGKKEKICFLISNYMANILDNNQMVNFKDTRS